MQTPNKYVVIQSRQSLSVPVLVSTSLFSPDTLTTKPGPLYLEIPKGKIPLVTYVSRSRVVGRVQLTHNPANRTILISFNSMTNAPINACFVKTNPVGCDNLAERSWFNAVIVFIQFPCFAEACVLSTVGSACCVDGRNALTQRVAFKTVACSVDPCGVINLRSLPHVVLTHLLVVLLVCLKAEISSKPIFFPSGDDVSVIAFSVDNEPEFWECPLGSVGPSSSSISMNNCKVLDASSHFFLCSIVNNCCFACGISTLNGICGSVGGDRCVTLTCIYVLCIDCL